MNPVSFPWMGVRTPAQTSARTWATRAGTGRETHSLLKRPISSATKQESAVATVAGKVAVSEAGTRQIGEMLAEAAA